MEKDQNTKMVAFIVSLVGGLRTVDDKLSKHFKTTLRFEVLAIKK